MYGWAGQRLKVYLTDGKIVKEPLPEELRLEYLGGRGFNSKTLFDELRPGIDPLSPENVLIVGVGPLAGTLAPGMARGTVTAKSPLSGIFGDGNAGGGFAAELKFAGYDQIIFYGQSPTPVYLWIKDDQVELRDASHLWGKTTWETHDLLVEELGDRQIYEFCIGPAGENLVRLSKLSTSTTKASGKGLGAVMGSKKIKAVVARGSGSIKIAKPAEFYEAARHTYDKLMQSPYQQALKEEGTFYIPRWGTKKRNIATRNAQSGYFEGWEKLTSEAFEAQYAIKHTGCFACPIACKHYYQVKDSPYATHGSDPEYGTVAPFTFKCGSDNLAAGLLATTLCDQLGLDTHTVGSTISFAMECWQRGLLTTEDTDGLDLSWGNDEAVTQLVRKIAFREGFGNRLAEGSRIASKYINGSEVLLAECKGLECSSFYPGEYESKMTALAYATSTIGGSIQRAGFRGFQKHPKVKQIMGEEASKRLLDPQVYEGQGVALAMEQDFVAALNSVEACLLLCRVVEGLDEDDLAWLVSTATGVELNGDGLLKVGERVYTVERAFNVREGLRREDDTMSPRFFVEEATPWGITGLNRAKFEAMLDEYYRFRGWNRDGIPTKKKLEELDLGYIADKIRAR